jgi:hypothetical protein
MVTEVLSWGEKRLVREVGHSPPSSAEVKNEWSCTSTPTPFIVPHGLDRDVAFLLRYLLKMLFIVQTILE